MVLIALSASPLPCGYLGLLVLRVKPQDCEKIEKRLTENCGQLPVSTLTGMPKIDFRWGITRRGSRQFSNFDIPTVVVYDK